MPHSSKSNPSPKQRCCFRRAARRAWRFDGDANETTEKTCGRNFSDSREAEISRHLRRDAALVGDARGGSGIVAGRHLQAHVWISLSVSAEKRVRRFALFPWPFHALLHPSQI